MPGRDEGRIGEGQTVAESRADAATGQQIIGTANRIRSGYFWFYAAIGAFSPFVSLYYRDLGMTGLQLGVLMALPALWAALTGPVWGAVADSLAIHRMLLRITLLVATVVALLATRPTHFVSLLILMSILAASLVPIAPLMDSYAITEAERRGTSYGSLRVMGSIGYTVMVLVMGWVLGDDVSSRFLIWYAGCLALAWLSIFGLPRLVERRPRPLLDGLQAVGRSAPFLLLILVAYLLASGFAVISSFLSIHMQELGASTDLIGVAFAVSAVSEFPVLFFSGWLLTRVRPSRVLLIAICAYLARFAILSVAPDAGWIIASQLMHGLSFGAFLIASVTLAHRLVGKENAATAQAVLGTMSIGFGSITGSLIAGALLDVVSTYTIFRGVTLLMGATLAIFVVGNRFYGIEAKPAG